LTTESKKKTPAKKSESLTWVDKDGNEQVLEAPKRFSETTYFDEQAANRGTFPGVPQAVFGEKSNEFDSAGRPSITGENLILLEVAIRDDGDKQYGHDGKWFLAHVLSQGDGDFGGEFSVPIKGEAVIEAVESMTGVKLETGKSFKPSELPVSFRVLFAAGAGKFGRGYFYPADTAKLITEA